MEKRNAILCYVAKAKICHQNDFYFYLENSLFSLPISGNIEE